MCVSSAFVPRGNPREFSWNSRIISGARDGLWTNFIHELRFQRSFLRKQEIRLARERAFLLVIERAASHGGGNPVTLNGLVARFILSGVAEDGETTISLYNVFFNLVYSRKFGELWREIVEEFFFSSSDFYELFNHRGKFEIGGEF